MYNRVVGRKKPKERPKKFLQNFLDDIRTKTFVYFTCIKSGHVVDRLKSYDASFLARKLRKRLSCNEQINHNRMYIYIYILIHVGTLGEH